MITTQTREVDLADLDLVRSSIAKANKKATKIGVPGYVLIEGARGHRDVVAPDPFNPGSWKVIGQVETIHVEVLGEAPKYAGWTFVGTLTWDGDQCVVRKVEGLDVEIGSHRPQAQWCDHCKTARDRNDTYLLRHDSGEFKQVGSTCLREFLGVNVNLALIGYNPYEGCDPTNRYEPTRVYVAVTLAYAIAATRLWGWVSAGATYGDPSKTSTKERVSIALWDRGEQGKDYRRCIAEATREEDAQRVTDVIAWVQSVQDNSDYIANLKAAIGDGVTARADNLGLLASAPNAYQRWLDREAAKTVERTSLASSEFVGTEKERLRNLRLTVVSTRWLEDKGWGSSLLVILRDEAGNAFKWFASNPARALETTGTTVVLDGTVKKHEVYNGLKSTVLTRCSVKEVVTSAA